MPPTKKHADPPKKAVKKAASLTVSRKRKQIAPKLFPVVGIGASAGGLEALRLLLQSLRPDTGMAFVVVTHLGHGQKSALSELLGRATGMPVVETSGEIAVQPNHVYVRPADQQLTMSNGTLCSALASTESHGLPVVIDTFLCSLAEHRKHQAIGIILSGSGSDGRAGLAAIKAAGGVTFAQDQESAKVGDMPRAAATAADFVLPPQEIAAELARIALHSYVAAPRGTHADDPAVSAQPGLAPIFALVRAATGIEFSQYKLATIHRRIARRMVLHHIDTYGAYLKKLQADPKELDALHADLLINVTQFFRDADVFAFLSATVLPEILDKHTGLTPIRVWVPACASGEEAYSIAICLLETIASRGRTTPIQVFGTDVSASAIKRARDAVYPPAIAEDVSPERLERFFVCVDGGYRISRAVRDSCVFALQDVTADPPFSKMDLVSCRNLLIYLKAEIQERVLATFHYALNPGGTLLLGSAETIGSAAGDLFRQRSRTHRIYERCNTQKKAEFYFRTRGETRRQTQHLHPTESTSLRDGDDIEREADRIVMTHYAPPCVVIGPSMDIQQFRGSTGLYLEPAPGPASLNLLKMCREGLSLELRSAIHQARKSNSPVVREGIRVRSNGGFRFVDVDVVPLRRPIGANHELIVFRACHPPAATTEDSPGASPGNRAVPAQPEREIIDLRRELVATQEDLRSIIQDLEANNEDLQSANEEILSSNEELQSTNEELETAKEELQATNEELTTVNDELRTRNSELKLANDDLINSLGSIDTAVVMLSSDLSVRRFNPGAHSTLGLVASDLGRPLSNIKTRLAPANPEDLVRLAIDTRSPRETHVRDVDGRWQLLRARPYITLDNKLDGAVLTVDDIHDQRDTLAVVRESEQRWKDLIGHGPDVLVAADPLGKILFVNRACPALLRAAVVDEMIIACVSSADRAKWRRVLSRVVSSGKPAKIESTVTRPGAKAVKWVIRIGAVTANEKVIGVTIRTEQPPK